MGTTVSRAGDGSMNSSHKGFHGLETTRHTCSEHRSLYGSGCGNVASRLLARAEIERVRPCSREQVICAEDTVQADLDRVWDAWTTEEGVRSFLAPACDIQLEIDGLYEILFDPGAEPGRRGAEGTRIMAIQPPDMLAFTWNATPHLPKVRDRRTHVVVRLSEIDEAAARITLTHDGWGEGDEWDRACAYSARLEPHRSASASVQLRRRPGRLGRPSHAQAKLAPVQGDRGTYFVSRLDRSWAYQIHSAEVLAAVCADAQPGSRRQSKPEGRSAPSDRSVSAPRCPLIHRQLHPVARRPQP
jgi:uncharacterized protein YndB with AHSA1/START domain